MDGPNAPPAEGGIDVDNSGAMRLWVIIPALNEEKTVGDVVRGALALDIPGVNLHVLVVDDGSDDDTSRVARDAGAIVVRHPVNRGLGTTFRTGMSEALRRGADIIVNIDGDGQFDPADIPTLIQPILAGEADFVTASRFADPALIPDMPGIKIWGNQMMSRLISVLTGKRFHDVSCGFRAYSRECALRLNLWGRFTYTQESFLDLAVKGMRIREVPVRVLGVRPFGESRMASNLWQYGIRTLRIIFRSYRDYWPLPFFSWLALFAAVPGVSLLTFFFTHYFLTGSFRPHRWAGFTGGAFCFLAVGLLAAGLFADILKRIRLNQEEMLYLLRRARYAPRNAEEDRRDATESEGRGGT